MPGHGRPLRASVPSTALRGHFAAGIGTGYADYVGGGTGLTVRDDLGGLNLSTVPTVFIECGDMRDAQDAALLTDASGRMRAAQGIADGSWHIWGGGR